MFFKSTGSVLETNLTHRKRRYARTIYVDVSFLEEGRQGRRHRRNELRTNATKNFILWQVSGAGGNYVGGGAVGGCNVPVVLRGLPTFKNPENQNQGAATKTADNSGKNTQLCTVE